MHVIGSLLGCWLDCCLQQRAESTLTPTALPPAGEGLKTGNPAPSSLPGSPPFAPIAASDSCAERPPPTLAPLPLAGKGPNSGQSDAIQSPSTRHLPPGCAAIRLYGCMAIRLYTAIRPYGCSVPIEASDCSSRLLGGECQRRDHAALFARTDIHLPAVQRAQTADNGQADTATLRMSCMGTTIATLEQAGSILLA